MLSRLRVLLLLPLSTLIACGGSSSPVTGTSFTPVGGDYVITVGVGTAGQANFTGDLVVNDVSACNGSTVCGVFRYSSPSACVSGSQDIPFTGSFSGNTLTLTSASFSSSVATLAITLPLSANNLGQSLAGGTSVITGGTCAQASSTLQAQLMPSYGATWAATFTSPSAATASLVLTQSATANQDGEFPATGTVNINDPTCGITGLDTSYTGLVSGGNLQLKSSQYNVTIIANTTGSSASPATVTIAGDLYGSSLPACTTTLSGTMVLQ
jgi:hypothetical protein